MVARTGAPIRGAFTYIRSIRVGAALVAALPRQIPLRVWHEGAHKGRPTYIRSICVGAALVAALPRQIPLCVWHEGT